jgi:flavin-dependent dehydrogenase
VTTALVVGAGPAGLSAATRLSTWCDSVTVIDGRRRGHARRAGEHLPPAGVSTLAALGFEQLVCDRSHDDSSGVRSVWADDVAVDKDYFWTTPGRGVNLRRDTFDEALAQRAEQHGVSIRFGTRLEELARDGSAFTAAVRNAHGTQTVHADIVVDASGRRAAAARLLGGRCARADRLVGLVGRIDHCALGDEVGRIHIESVENGWWYAVQFSDGTLLATFMTDLPLVQRHPLRARGVWLDELRKWTRLAPVANSGTWTGRVDVFDAATQIVDYAEQHGFLATGDAAAAHDPLSSWGITKAMRDGCAAADALALEHRGDLHAVRRCRESQRREFRDFRSRQIELYAAVNRWPASPFWRARRTTRDQQTY